MFRKLTTGEMELISNAKKVANDAIKEQRKHLRAEMKKLMLKTPLEKQLEGLTLVKGYPVMATVKGDPAVCVDWSMVRKLELSMRKGYSVFYEVTEGALIIKYEKEGITGRVELFELPQHQVEQLQNRVPVIFI
jgi:hypothetical protein